MVGKTWHHPDWQKLFLSWRWSMQQLPPISADHENMHWVLWPDTGMWLHLRAQSPWLTPSSKTHHRKASTTPQTSTTSQGNKCSTLWTFGGHFIFSPQQLLIIVSLFHCYLFQALKHINMFFLALIVSTEKCDVPMIYCHLHAFGIFLLQLLMSCEKIAYWSCLFRVLNSPCTWIPISMLGNLLSLKRVFFFFFFYAFCVFVCSGFFFVCLF